MDVKNGHINEERELKETAPQNKSLLCSWYKDGCSSQNLLDSATNCLLSTWDHTWTEQTRARASTSPVSLFMWNSSCTKIIGLSKNLIDMRQRSSNTALTKRVEEPLYCLQYLRLTRRVTLSSAGWPNPLSATHCKSKSSNVWRNVDDWLNLGFHFFLYGLIRMDFTW